jgi:hypothetical protein
MVVVVMAAVEAGVVVAAEAGVMAAVEAGVVVVEGVTFLEGRRRMAFHGHPMTVL